MSLRQNPGRWNRQYGMLFVDQPIGTGFSVAGEHSAVVKVSLRDTSGVHPPLPSEQAAALPLPTQPTQLLSLSMDSKYRLYLRC